MISHVWDRNTLILHHISRGTGAAPREPGVLYTQSVEQTAHRLRYYSPHFLKL